MVTFLSVPASFVLNLAHLKASHDLKNLCSPNTKSILSYIFFSSLCLLCNAWHAIYLKNPLITFLFLNTPITPYYYRAPNSTYPVINTINCFSKGKSRYVLSCKYKNVVKCSERLFLACPLLTTRRTEESYCINTHVQDQNLHFIKFCAIFILFKVKDVCVFGTHTAYVNFGRRNYNCSHATAH